MGEAEEHEEGSMILRIYEISANHFPGANKMQSAVFYHAPPIAVQVFNSCFVLLMPNKAFKSLPLA